MKYLQSLRHLKKSRIGLIAIVLMLAILPLVNVVKVSALPITGKSILLSNSVGDATGVTYTFSSAALPTTTAVKSVEIKICSALPPAGCVTPTGFSSSSSTLASQPTGLGSSSGWTVDSSTAGSLRIINGSNATTSSGSVSISWNGVHNPTAVNTSFYGIITTYSAVGFTGALDSGAVALSTSSTIQVALTVDETLTFCTGTSITNQDCGSIAGSVVNLGVGSTTVTAKGTSVMAASTNGNTGYSITVTGNTLTSGANTITALAAGGASSVGNKQFGLNLASANTTPVVGAARTGAGTATATANYNINNTFRFNSGDQVVSVAGPTNANAFTVGYIANIDGLTPAGAYTTNLTYTATANF